MPAAAPRYLSAAFSDQGFVRPNNEDRVYCDDRRGVFLVVDGVGGHEAGEEAAEIAIQRIRARLERQTDSVEQRVREAITLANNAIYETAEEHPEWKGMACVLTAAVIENGRVTVGHVGDSRLYSVSRGSIRKVTHDHSPVGEREDSGELTELAAMQHPRRNEVYRDVGSREHAPDDEDFIETFQFPFAPDSALLLCSDGLTDAVPSDQILSVIKQHAGDRWATVQTLIAAATKVGHDNVSVVWVEGDQFAASFAKHVEEAPTIRQSLSWYRRGPVLMIFGVLLGAGLMYAAGNYLLRRNAVHIPRTIAVAPSGSISEALRTAQPGDTVAVAPGVYAENISLKEGVSVLARRAGEAVIQGEVTADSLHAARLEGFEVRGGDFGIRINSSSVTLAHDNFTGSHQAGIEFKGDSHGAVFGCTIQNNEGPGITLSETAAPVIENNLVLNNGKQPDRLRPGLILRSTAKPTILRNTFAGNGAEPVWLAASDEEIVQRNFFLSSIAAEIKPNFRVVPLEEGRP